MTNLTELSGPVRVLTNITGSPLALELTPGQVTYLQPEEQILYSSIVDGNPNSTTYNLDRILHVVGIGVLSDTEVLVNKPDIELSSVAPISFSAEVRSETSIRLATRSYTQTQNHLEIIPVTNDEDELLIIYYRDVEGMSYSLDGGNSTISISNSNLRYPSEVTSAAVQIFESPLNSRPILKLFIGTLREGIKSFTPSKDATYIDETSYESVYTVATEAEEDDPKHPDTHLQILPTYRNDFLFRHYTRNLVSTTDSSDGTPYLKYDGREGDTYSHTADGYAPTFILGILNYPINNGCPIIAYSRTQKDGILDYKFMTKMLSPVRYNMTTVGDNIIRNLVSSELELGSELKSNTGWILLQQNDILKYNIGLPVLQNDILDITDMVNKVDYVYTLQKHTYSTTKFRNAILSIKSSVNSLGLPPTLSAEYINTLPDELEYNRDVKSIHVFDDAVHGNRYVFMTSDDSVWVHKNEWKKFIHKELSYEDISTKYFTTGLTETMFLAENEASKRYDLTGFSGFSLSRLPNTLNLVFGFLSTAIGVIRYYLDVRQDGISIRISPSIKPRVILSDMPRCKMTDFTSIFGTGILLGCNYNTPFKSVYNTDNELCHHISSLSASEEQKETALRNNYIVKNENLVNFITNNLSSVIPIQPSDQVLSLFINRSPALDVILRDKIKTCLQTKDLIPLFTRVKTSTDPDEPLFTPLFDTDLYLFLVQSFGKYIHLSIRIDASSTNTISNISYTLSNCLTFYTHSSAYTFESPNDIYLYDQADFEGNQIPN